MTMSEKIKEILQSPEVPDELKPENIPVLLQTKGKRKNKISMAVTGTVAAAAACTLIVTGLSFVTQENRKDAACNFTACDIAVQDNGDAAGESDSEDMKTESAESDSHVSAESAFVPIGSYEEIYKQIRENDKKQNFGDEFGSVNKGVDAAVPDGAVSEERNDITESFSTSVENETAGETDVYETLSQVEGIAEADIIKASAECVYYVTDGKLRYIPFDKNSGKFGDSEVVNISHEAGITSDMNAEAADMYLSGDILVVIGRVHEDYSKSFMYNTFLTGVFIFDVSGKSPEFVQSSFQTGIYSSSRMKDNILYLITNQSTSYGMIVDEVKYEEYIPRMGNTPDTMECLPCESIYVPRDQNSEYFSGAYTNISAIDINDTSKAVSSISVVGWSGEIYCSADNIYIAASDYSSGGINTVITRFTLENNVIAPACSGTVNGYVLNQFSMDEYNGYLRIAATSYNDESYEPVNNVYVLDMDMNVVGSVTGFAETETVKSVSFNGDTGYVVTYEQTDPLFAIDLSDPFNPYITDEFKITGYSSFLRKWSDDLLLGFGIDADEDAYEVGVKLVMFDVSDSGELKECGYYAVSGENAHGIESPAVYNRKALLLSPEKNIIGFPVNDYSGYYKEPENVYFDDIEDYSTTENGYQLNPLFTYRIFSYENGQFTEKKVVQSTNGGYSGFERGIYIGDYICIFSNHEGVCVDINNLEETDRVTFD